jgi:hypothetical protein
MQYLSKAAVFFVLVIFLVLPHDSKAQDVEEDTLQTVSTSKSKRGFHLGVYVGAFFANKYTASLYDGYGYDINGQRNNFANSVLRNEIVNNYGGGNNGVDQIAQLLNVDHKDWNFNESGMPINLKYTPTYLVGLNMRYVVDKKQAITLNVNGTKLIVNGKFNINTTNAVGTSTNPSTAGQSKQNQFTIIGGEQRLMFQLGYQRYFGKNEKINFFAEVGLNIIMSKFQKNQAILNTNSGTLTIDLMNIYNLPDYNFYRAKYFVGVGIGAYAGFGINLNVNPKYTVQLLYNPSYDRIPLGDVRAFKMQNGVGIRFYYNMK